MKTRACVMVEIVEEGFEGGVGGEQMAQRNIPWYHHVFEVL